ncbi:CHAT domain-containing protein [Chloroflexales bacterium ZM16-3]|nr:CHAT domain-containing protein [Chloroflexales bacterium ZM16-3]
MQEIDDLLVRVSRRDASNGHAYVVEMWLEGGRRVNAQEELQLDDYVEPQLGDATTLAAHGLDLFNRLFSGRLSVAFQQAWASAVARDRMLRVRLALDPEAPAVHAVPWELLHFDDSGGMSPARPMAADGRVAFSRYIESADFDEGEPVSRRPLRLLLVIADPTDLKERWGLAPVGRASEERDFRTRFGPIISSGQFRYDVLPVASAQALQDAISQGGIGSEQPNGYDVLLCMCHAAYNEQYGTRLLLEDQVTQRARLYPTNDLVSLMQQLPESHRPAMVALVACNSATTWGNQTMNSLAVRLVIGGGVPAVLAMQRLVEITLARRFTYHLSEHLLREGLIDVAVNTARRRVYAADDIGWSTPTLYMRTVDGRLFTPNAQLEYVQTILADPTYVRWSGPEFIESGVLAVAPGQNWSLLRSRPEDAPASVSVIDTLHRILDQGHLGDRHHHGKAPPGGYSTITAVIGPPHSGQTTILQRMAYDLALKVTDDPSSPPGIMISLTGYESQRGAARLEQHIVEQAQAANAALGDALTELFRPQTVLRASYQRPRYIFLLDNLDSIPEKARIDVANDLSALATRMVDQQFVLTSSQENFPTQALSSAHVLVIQPLTEQQIFHYIRGRDERDAYKIFSQIRENRLLALASDMSLLALIYARMAGDQQARLTRNQLVQEYLDQAISGIAPRYIIGDAARESLSALAWHSRWNHVDQLPMSEVFHILAEIRHDRDYSLEDLYRALCDARLLIGVGQGTARFVNPAIQTYCAAVALSARQDMAERLRDIISLCSSPKRQIWWEDVLYSLAGMVGDPAPLFEHLASAIRTGSYTHALIAARCMEALPPEQDARLSADLREELLDACVLRLRADREPSADRREQIATALGRLSHPQVRHELRRILVERVRATSSGPRYEYTNVRIAAARALRNIYLPSNVQGRRTDPQDDLASLLLTNGDPDMVSLADQAGARPAPMPPIIDIRNDQILVRLMRVWGRGAAGRAEFRSILRNSPNPPERALAAFALGDMADAEGKKLLDARLLLRVILSPTDTADERISADWEDTMWAAADALTLFEPNQVAPLLTVLVKRKQTIPNSAAQQLAYLAGRLRAASPEVISWLIELLITNPSQTIKSKALQSLAWMGMGVEKQRLELGDGRPGPTLKQIIENIAAGQKIRQLKLGRFAVAKRASDIDGQPIYLRRKAIEALAWIGDAETMRSITGQVATWPLELREHWYLAAATIRERTGGGV